MRIYWVLQSQGAISKKCEFYCSLTRDAATSAGALDVTSPHCAPSTGSHTGAARKIAERFTNAVELQGRRKEVGVSLGRSSVLHRSGSATRNTCRPFARDHTGCWVASEDAPVCDVDRGLRSLHQLVLVRLSVLCWLAAPARTCRARIARSACVAHARQLRKQRRSCLCCC